MTSFKSYLKNIKAHLLEISSTQRINSFFTKLLSKLRQKILIINDIMLKNKKEFLIKIIMLKSIKSRKRNDDALNFTN